MHSDTLLLATRSAHKAREIRDILGPVMRQTLLPLDEAGIHHDAAEEGIEVFDTFLLNAHAKAAYFLARTRTAVIADDSGICVDALDGAPGVRSRRFAHRHGLDGAALDRANNERLLRELLGLAPHRRTAHYACAAVLHLPDGRRFSALGTCSGIIADAPRGTHGFGYDPLFLIPHASRTFGEMSVAEKHRFSHRARAFRALASVIDPRTLSR